MKDRYDNQNVVISIPASGTIELIYKYQIHAHPDKAGYGYKNTLMNELIRINLRIKILNINFIY
ncbi:Uncharacterised protein [[Clostridium] sordellii]|uniref:hypothetical protein n=1 Tax=Paraclostridium sordellii TaxID=1505 RepID=UPI0005DAF372|nr:hypothetical protein [Paeniclostridium sordellii]CEN74605.1 Uncharacterised protein [[Clostridium] sordellii] [Paeniclostridium sordellii]